MDDFNDFTAENLNREFANELSPDEEFDEEEIEDIKAEGVPPERPSFPLITFIFAVLLDVLKPLVQIFSLGLLGIVISILGFILTRIYLIGKIGGIKRFIWKNTIVTAVKGSIPFLGAFLGSWSYFILRAHSKNYKRIDQILTFIEKLGAGGKSL